MERGEDLGLSDQPDSAQEAPEEMDGGSDFDQEDEGSPKKIGGEDSEEVEDE